MQELLAYQVEASVATLTLQRPERRNALDGALVEALAATLRQAAGDDAVRVVVLTGQGDAFSAGADLAALQAMQAAAPADNLADAERLAALFEQIYLLPKPVIARVNGAAVGGGCGLAAVCDISVAATSARLGFPEVRLGFVPAVVAVFVLRKLGEAAARDLLLRGALVKAETAAAMGLVTRAVPDDALDEAVTSLARELATEPAGTAVALTKRLLAHVPGMGLQEALAYAAQLNAFARGTDDCRAGVAAFLEKTDPPWRRGT